MSGQKLTLYIWPQHWNLPSFDPDCLSSVFFLQLNFAGRYDLVECTDPDLSPSGTLPFLVHNSKQIATSRSILSYLSTLKDERENGAIEEDKVKAQRTAWNAYANRQLRDIVVCQLVPRSHTRTELSDDLHRTTFYTPMRKITRLEYIPLWWQFSLSRLVTTCQCD